MAFKLPSMPRLSVFGKKSCLAVDVGTSAVKICKLSGGGGKYKVDLWDSLPVPPGLTGKDFETKATELLKEMVDKHKFKKQLAIFALPAQSVIIRYLTFQGIPRDRLEGVVRHEAEGHIPFPLEEVSLDWCEARKKDNGFEVLLVAIKKDKLDSMVTIIEEAGLEVQIVDVTTLALFSLYYHGTLKDEKEEDIAEVFVDIGSGTTDIAFIKNHRVFFTRSVPIAGRSFTEIIVKRMGVPEDRAEDMKIKHAEVKAIVADLTQLEGDAKTPGGLAGPKAPGGLPGSKAPGLAAPKAPGLAAPSAGGLAPPKSPGLSPPSAGGLMPPKAAGLTPPSAGGLVPPPSAAAGAPPAAGGLKPPASAPPAPPTTPAVGDAKEDKEIPIKISEVPLPKPPMMKPPAMDGQVPNAPGMAPQGIRPPAMEAAAPPAMPAPKSPEGAPAAAAPAEAPAPKPPALSLPKPPLAAAPPPGLGAPKPPAPAPSTPDAPAAPKPAPPPGIAAPKPPALSLPKPPAPAAPSPGSAPDIKPPGPPPPPGLGVPKPPALSLPKPPAPPGLPTPKKPDSPEGKSLGAAKAEDGEVFTLFESGDEKVDKEKLSAAVKPIADRMATELRRSFDYFMGQLGGGEIKRVNLSGGGAALKGLAEYLSTQLNVPVTVYDPMKKVTGPAGKEGLTNPQGFSTVIGMGMRMLDGSPLDIDMLPENIVAVRRMRSMGKDLKFFAVAAVLLLGLVGLYAFMTVHNAKTLLAKIQSDIQELAPVAERVRQLEKDQKTVNDLEKSIATLVGSRANWMAVLTALDKTLPENAFIRFMGMPTKEKIEIRIVTSSLAEIPEIGKRFQSPDFTKGLFTLTNRPNPRQGETPQIFEVDFTLQVNHMAATKAAEPGAPGT